MKKWTVNRILQAKGRQKLACLTAYDCTTARLIDECGLPLILVGDSVGMTMLGFETTLPVTMEHMLHHTAAVTRGIPCITTVQGLGAAVQGVEALIRGEIGVRSLQEYAADLNAARAAASPAVRVSATTIEERS